MGIGSSRASYSSDGPFTSPSRFEARLAALYLSSRLPMELALHCLDLAEYWPKITYTLRQPGAISSVGPERAVRMVVTSPLPGGEPVYSIRRIRILTDSRDQGERSRTILMFERTRN